MDNKRNETMNLENLPKPRVKLVGRDGNAFAILGSCASALRKAGWKKEEIDAFHREATSGDYDNLLMTATKHCDVL